MSLIAIIGLITFVTVVLLLLKSPFSPVAIFILVPTVGALVAGYSLSEIGEFVKLGYDSVQTAFIVTAFAIFFFSIMVDVGMFEVITTPIIRGVSKRKNPVIAIMLAAAAVACIGHMDGAGATTIMVTLPLMMPFFDKLEIDRRALGLSMGIVVGFMNLLPWTGPTRYTAIVMGLDPVALWRYIIPAEVIMLFISFIFVYFIGRREIKRGAVNTVLPEMIEQECSGSLCTINKKYFIFNISLTAVLLAVLISGILKSDITFMIFASIAMIVNYRGKKAQNSKLKGFAPNILPMVFNVLSVGVLIGIMQQGGFVNALAELIVKIMPASIGPYTYIIIALCATPLLMVLGTSAYYQGMMPIIVGVAAQYDVNPLLAACVILVPSGAAVSLSPLVPANHIACGMLGYGISDSIKYGWKWVVLIAWIAVPVTYITVKFLL